jgi:hypothetical protein
MIQDKREIDALKLSLGNEVLEISAKQATNLSPLGDPLSIISTFSALCCTHTELCSNLTKEYPLWVMMHSMPSCAVVAEVLHAACSMSSFCVFPHASA